MTLERGTLLHKRYRIVEILGQGGMGSVYRALDENLGVEVAVKENLFTSDEYARQFRLEAVILANLRHPNLPRVTDHFVMGEEGQYLIMDFIEGEDLRQRMERIGFITDEEAILIGAAMCDALHFLHTRNPSIIHRDVKPGNVKITPDGRIYLVDFGLAKVVKGAQATTTGARAMTPGYSPPEQYGTARTDPRTDVYSLAATLYAALTSVIPEDGLARAMDSVELTPLRRRNPKVSRKLAATIERAMAVRAEDRYQTAEEFRQALLSAGASKTQRLNGEIVVEPPPAVPAEAGESPEDIGEPPDKPITAQLVPVSQPVSRPPVRRWSPGCRMFSFALILTLLAGAVLLAVFWSPIAEALGWGRATPTFIPSLPVLFNTATATSTMKPSDTPVLPVDTSTPTLTATFAPTDTATITPLPTDTLIPTATLMGGGYSQIAFASSRPGEPQIFIMNADGTDQQQLTDVPGGACQPDWSPDGQEIVFTSPCSERKEQYRGSKLYLIEVKTKAITELPTVEGGDFDPAWSPDGTRIAFTSLREGNAQIYIINLADNVVTLLSDPTDGKQSRQPAWSPTGTQILFTLKRYELPYQIWVMSSAGKGAEQVVRSGTVFWDFLPYWSSDGKTILFSQSEGSLQIGWLKTILFEQRGTQDAAVGLKGGSYALDAEYSPDGFWLVFEGIDAQNPNSTNYDIYLLTFDGRNRTRLTTDKAVDFDPAWRPIAP